MQDLSSLASNLGIDPRHVCLLGHDKAKIGLEALNAPNRTGKLILVSAITPTPAGEGKTTVSIGLAQGLKKIGRATCLALRQPSMGPVFGRKGGATGGGRSTLQPATDINLHFTGDFHAITTANNLLAAVLDNRLHFKSLPLSANEVLWKRVLDVNDRSLRNIQTQCGTETERSTGFNITAASEIMAVVCLAQSAEDLRARLDRIVVGFDSTGTPLFAKELKITGALLAILRDALKPNLVQSIEGVPAFVHGGPFANIAHGCNSILATRMALHHSEIAVTEAGFAFDLGGEKFFNIKCRQSGIAPSAIVIVATVRALKHHGNGSPEDSSPASLAALEQGMENLAAHLDAARQFGRPVIVAINRFQQDTAEELSTVLAGCQKLGVPAAIADVFGQGGAGAEGLAILVDELLPPSPPPIPWTYPEDSSAEEKLHQIATRIYGANGVKFADSARHMLARLEKAGFARLPICVAKTQESLSDNPKRTGRPKDFSITVRDFEIAHGAGFLVALTGQILRMPALPKIPAAERIDVSESGVISGL